MFPRALNAPSVSPHPIKLETFLRAVGISATCRTSRCCCEVGDLGERWRGIDKQPGRCLMEDHLHWCAWSWRGGSSSQRGRPSPACHAGPSPPPTGRTASCTGGPEELPAVAAGATGRDGQAHQGGGAPDGKVSECPTNPPAVACKVEPQLEYYVQNWKLYKQFFYICCGILAKEQLQHISRPSHHQSIFFFFWSEQERRFLHKRFLHPLKKNV